VLLALPAQPAYISEIDLNGPAGQAIEVAAMDPADDYTLVVMDASPYRFENFGKILSVAPLSGGMGVGGTAMVSDAVWPGGEVLTYPLSALTPSPPTSALGLNFSRLVVLMRGAADLDLFQRPIDQPQGYDASAVLDWVLMGEGMNAAQYTDNGYDTQLINTTLGVDLFERMADTDAVRVIGRGVLPGEAMDLTLLHAGNPDAGNVFDAAIDAYRYRYTPGMENIDLLPAAVDPVPGDTDGDGDVDDADLGTAFSNYTGPLGASADKGPSHGDTDGDGDVDDADLGAAFAAYTGPLSSGTTVPEPVSLLALCVGVGLAHRRRR
jgi:hypothetical protein